MQWIEVLLLLLFIIIIIIIILFYFSGFFTCFFKDTLLWSSVGFHLEHDGAQPHSSNCNNESKKLKWSTRRHRFRLGGDD